MFDYFKKNFFKQKELKEEIYPEPETETETKEEEDLLPADNPARYTEPADDPYGLGRFLRAQAGVYPQALEEIRGGHKQSHWMWYIFPQADGLGESWFTQKYAIKSRAEAEAYYASQTLRENLLEITQALLGLEADNPKDVFRYPDDLKLKSCMTLFFLASGNPLFEEVLGKYYGGEEDEYTVEWWQGQ